MPHLLVSLLATFASTVLMATTQVFTANNFPLPSAPPGYFVSGNTQHPENGSSIPAGHTSWLITFDTTGLPNNQAFADIVVQYHYTNVQLGATGVANQGAVTNTDGSVTQITGGTFTGWIDDCESPLLTTHLAKDGSTVIHTAFFGCDLNRIPGAYPDFGRLLVKSSPGYANVPSATLNLN